MLYRDFPTYKYQLLSDEFFQTEIRPLQTIEEDFIVLDVTGSLHVKKGYCWDGPSGPTIDTKNFLRASLAHDALYQLMREQRLTPIPNRETADKLLHKLCLDAGMSKLRAWYVYKAVQIFGAKNALPAADKDFTTQRRAP